jgi:peptidoglycan/LPS O-acetylase OafA/YrhL
MKKRTFFNWQAIILVTLISIFLTTSKNWETTLPGNMMAVRAICVVFYIIGLLLSFLGSAITKGSDTFFLRLLSCFLLITSVILVVVMMGKVSNESILQWKPAVIIFLLVYIALKKIFLEIKLKFMNEE